MAPPNDPGTGTNASRLLSLLGQLLQELGHLVERDAPGRPVATHRAADPPSAARPEVPSVTPAPPPAAGAAPEDPVPTSMTRSEQLKQTLDEGFAALFGTDAEDEVAAAPPMPAKEAEVPATGSSQDAPPVLPSAHALYLVWEDEDGGRVAIPWNWVVDTHLSPSGAPEAFTLSDGDAEQCVMVGTIVGIWTGAELESRTEPVRWISSLADLPEKAVSTAARRVAEKPSSPKSKAHRPWEPPPRSWEATGGAAGSHAALHAPAAVEPANNRVWVVSPSALARRFLIRHLDQTGLEVREARDLDDPLFPADLGRAGALFLDENLQEHWRTHPAAAATSTPVVRLTVDGALSIPSEGAPCSQWAVLPRPFERTEVESVVGWLRDRWQGESSGRGGHHGDEEDDTWLFADPFGSQGT